MVVVVWLWQCGCMIGCGGVVEWLCSCVEWSRRVVVLRSNGDFISGEW